MCDKLEDCRCCKQQPEIIEISGMWYVKCYKCGSFELALRRKTAIENWNGWNKENGLHTLTVSPGCYSRRCDD